MAQADHVHDGADADAAGGSTPEEASVPPPAVSPGGEPVSRSPGPGASPLRALHAGSTLTASVLLGFGLGWWIDQRWETEPWATVVCSMVFIVAGIYQAIREEIR